MALAKVFEHQDYSKRPSPGSFEQVVPPGTVAAGSVAFQVSLAQARKDLALAGVRRIILVHGTLAGTDALGWYGSWQRFAPFLSRKLKRAQKAIVDRLARDRGNFTLQTEDLLEAGLNPDDSSPTIDVERFEWSSENHHLGRADAAVRLTDRLLDYRDANERVLLLGHSHAGNVFALVTNLTGRLARLQPERIKRFFDAARQFDAATRRIDVATWRRLEARLTERFELGDPTADGDSQVDFVTMGTPIRYGWDESGFTNLLHFVNHHPVDGVEAFRSVLPGSGNELVEAVQGDFGDFVQQTFIARSDFPPAVWSRSARKANRILRNLLEGSELRSRRLDRLRYALRVANTGKTLLVDYATVDPTAKETCGHAVYTDQDWLAFHLHEITSRFYRR